MKSRFQIALAIFFIGSGAGCAHLQTYNYGLVYEIESEINEALISDIEEIAMRYLGEDSLQEMSSTKTYYHYYGRYTSFQINLNASHVRISHRRHSKPSQRTESLVAEIEEALNSHGIQFSKRSDNQRSHGSLWNS